MSCWVVFHSKKCCTVAIPQPCGPFCCSCTLLFCVTARTERPKQGSAISPHWPVPQSPSPAEVQFLSWGYLGFPPDGPVIPSLSLCLISGLLQHPLHRVRHWPCCSTLCEQSQPKNHCNLGTRCDILFFLRNSWSMVLTELVLSSSLCLICVDNNFKKSNKVIKLMKDNSDRVTEQ